MNCPYCGEPGSYYYAIEAMRDWHTCRECRKKWERVFNPETGQWETVINE